MYPVARLIKEWVLHRNAPALKPGETHVSRHICWPWDIDPWMELNNGRALTLYDLGRMTLASRSGLFDVLRREGWGMTVAGSSVRYRRRVRPFDRIEMHSRLIGWDDRWMYLSQSMWVSGECASEAMLRTAVTDRNGIVDTDRVAAALNLDPASKFRPPAWVEAWADAEARRPWPPARG